MGEHSEVYVAFDTAKLKHAVAVAEGGRRRDPVCRGDREPASDDRAADQEAGAALQEAAGVL